MISIDSLRIRLPEGFERRAGRIARLVGEELSRLPVARDFKAGVLRIGEVRVAHHQTDRRVAAAIAAAIHGRTQAGG